MLIPTITQHIPKDFRRGCSFAARKHFSWLPASPFHDSGPYIEHWDPQVVAYAFACVGILLNNFGFPASVVLKLVLIDGRRRDQQHAWALLFHERMSHYVFQILRVVFQGNVLSGRTFGKAGVVCAKENHKEADFGLRTSRVELW